MSSYPKRMMDEVKAKESYIYLHAMFHSHMPDSLPVNTWELQVFREPKTNTIWTLLTIEAQNGEMVEFKEKVSEFPSQGLIAAVHLLLC